MDSELRFLLFWRITGWLVVVLAWFVALDPTPPDLSKIQFGDKIVHTLSYMGMMLWMMQCYSRRYQWRLFTFFVLMGVCIEFLQGWSGYRSFEFADMIANSIGVFFGWAISLGHAGRIFYSIERLLRA